MSDLEKKYSRLIKEIGYVRLLNLSDNLKSFLASHSSSLEEKVDALEDVKNYLERGTW